MRRPGEGGIEAIGDEWSPSGRRAEEDATEWVCPGRRGAAGAGGAGGAGGLRGGGGGAGRRAGGGGVRWLFASAGRLPRRTPPLSTALLLLLVALLSSGVEAQSCLAGQYPNLGVCVPCDSGFASVAGSGSCTQVMSGEPFSIDAAGAPVVFPQWQKFDVALGDTLRVGLRAYTLPTSQVVGAKPDVTANEEWGLPEFATLCGSQGTKEADFVCPDGTAPNTEALLEFTPRPQQVREVYSTCAKGTVALQAGWVATPMEVCVEITVRSPGAAFTNTSTNATYQTPPEGTTYQTAVGCALEIPLEVSASPCVALACTISPASGTAADCSPTCGSSSIIGPQPLGGSALLEGFMLSRRPMDDAGMPQTDASAPQFWLLEWSPMVGAGSQVPYNICISPGPGGLERCFEVTVEKCRHCLGSGDTLDSVAGLHKADWLQLYLANPSLPSHNPAVVAPGFSVRLGVSHRVRKGEYLEQLADKFLVPTEALLHENRELWAPAALRFLPNAPSASTEISATFYASRVLMGGESIRLSLPHLGGESWQGSVSLSCDQVSLSSVYGEYPQRGVPWCDDEAAPGLACGPGRWGVCKYDDVGKIMCEVKECASYGQHPLLSEAAWEDDTHMLTVHVREGASIANGQEVSFVISRSAGILYPPTGVADPNVRAVFPVPTTVQLDVPRPFELCVILPLCDTKLQCIFGVDCSLVELAK